jgi:hypothetical protein
VCGYFRRPRVLRLTVSFESFAELGGDSREESSRRLAPGIVVDGLEAVIGIV